MRTALVTGGSGFVAGHVVAALLERGCSVRTTVRDPQNVPKTVALRTLQERHPGQLEIFAADLLDEGSFDAAADGVDTVFHVASPFYMAEQIKDPQQDLIEPAVKGTRNVLRAVNRAESVRRAVLTSTIGAMFGDYADVLDPRSRRHPRRPDRGGLEHVQQPDAGAVPLLKGERRARSVADP